MDVFVRERLPGHLEWTSRPVVLCGPSIVLWALLRTFDTYKAAIGWAWYSFGFFLPTLRDKGCDEALKLRQGLGNLELWERSRCMGQRRGLRGDGIVDIVSDFGRGTARGCAILSCFRYGRGLEEYYWEISKLKKRV